MSTLSQGDGLGTFKQWLLCLLPRLTFIFYQTASHLTEAQDTKGKGWLMHTGVMKCSNK